MSRIWDYASRHQLGPGAFRARAHGRAIIEKRKRGAEPGTETVRFLWQRPGVSEGLNSPGRTHLEPFGGSGWLPGGGSAMLRRGETVLFRALQALRDFIYGMTIYDWVHELDKARYEQERLFILVICGDLMGIPILPPYYTMRLLPYMVPAWENWRRSLLRERDLTDLFGQEIG